MYRLISIFLFALLAIGGGANSFAATRQKADEVKVEPFNRQHLHPRAYAELPLGAIEAEVKIGYWFDCGVAVERGALLYALKMNEKWERKEFEATWQRQLGKEYFEVYSTTPWNWGFEHNDLKANRLAQTFTFERKGEMALYPWNMESAPITIKAKMHQMVDWREYNGSSGPINYRTRGHNIQDMATEEEVVELIPYGCTTLRLTLFPVRKLPKK